MPPRERKRPWYLALALLGALALGSIGSCLAWGTIGDYREAADPTVYAQGVTDEADRAAVIARAQAYFDILDASKHRAWPLAVASLLLGSAIIVFAMRAISGRGAARTALVQLVVVQAGVSVASNVLLRDERTAWLLLSEAQQAARMHEQVPDRSQGDAVARAAFRATNTLLPILYVLRTLGGALVVVGLTRRRSREFFDRPTDPVEDG
jgi:hypothetical protein